jgi:hypothetical protein
VTTVENLKRYIEFLEGLDRAGLRDLDGYVTEDVEFRDPFHDTVGSRALRRIFEDMFEKVSDVRFRVEHRASFETGGFFSWSLEGELRGKPWRVDGITEVAFADDGRVRAHIDQWDAASQFYEHFPLIGPLLRRLRRRVASP